VNVPQRVALTTAVQLAARVFLTAVGLVTFGLIARHLGVAGFGAYSLVLTFIPLFASLADLGVTTIGVREISKRPEARARIAGTVFTVKAVLGVAGALVLLAAIPLLPYAREVKVALGLALAGLLLHLLAMVPTVVFQSALRMDLQAAVDVTIGLTNLALVLAVIASGGGLHALVLAWVASVGAGCLVAFVLALRIVRFRPGLDRPLAAMLLRRALPLGLVLVASVVHFRVDAVLLSLLRPIDDVGVYNAAYRFLEHVLIAPALFMTAVFPVLAAYVASRDARLAATVQKALTFLLLLGMPIAVGAFVLARPIIVLVAGSAFEDAVTPLRILVAAVVVAFVNTLFANLLIAYDLQGRMLLVSLAAVALNVGLNLVLIPRYSYNGAAAATVVTEGLGAIVITAWAVRHGRLRLDWRPAARVGVAALGMGAVVVPAASLPLAVPIALGAVAYAALVAVLRVISRRDLRVLLRGEE
jgi:O-antigen/teichoic acid export membrane protein